MPRVDACASVPADVAEKGEAFIILNIK